MKTALIHHPMTAKLLERFGSQPQGSLLLRGNDLTGKTATLADLINSLQTQPANPIEQLSGPGPSYEPATITTEAYRLESLRGLIKRLALAPVWPDQPRLVVIDDFEKIQPASQNILLKSLEEPDRRTHFLLAAAKSGVLATISSRCQVIEMRRPDSVAVSAWQAKRWPEIDQGDRKSIYMQADGWPAAIVDLSGPEASSRLNNRIKQAKAFMTQAGPTERLIYIQKHLSRGPGLGPELESLLDGLIRISRAALINVAGAGKGQAARTWRRHLLRFSQLAANLKDGQTASAISLSLCLFDVAVASKSHVRI